MSHFSDSRRTFSIPSVLRMIISSSTTIVFIYKAIRIPLSIPISLASVNLIDRTVQSVTRSLEQYFRYSDFSESLKPHTELLALLDLPPGIIGGDLDYNDVRLLDFEALSRGMEVEFK